MAHPPPTLLSLPPPIQQRILREALSLDSSLARSSLASLGRTIATTAQAVLAHTLVLPDDDAILVDAEQGGQLNATASSTSTSTTAPHVTTPARTLVAAVWRNSELAEQVQQLKVVKAFGTDSVESPGSHELPVDQFVDQDDTQLNSIPPLEDLSFLLLLSKLPQLRSFHWSVPRHPPLELCRALGAASKSLTHFSFDLTDSPPEGTGVSSTSLRSPIIGGICQHPPPISNVNRWDAKDLSALPITLTHLSLSHFSQSGSKEVANAFASLPNLEELTLGRTVFVDDGLLAEVGNSAKKLRKLRIREMNGTKLSDTGLGDVFDGCWLLEELELEAVEGRFTKNLWTKVSPLPVQLRTLKLVYSEPPPHKSWVLDRESLFFEPHSLCHSIDFPSLTDLLSLPSALESDCPLTSLTISRKPVDGALVPGQHHHSQFPMDGIMLPKPLPEALRDAIVERGTEWKELNIDLFAVDVESLKKIMDACVGLTDLKVLFDAPFRSLLSLASSFALSQNLRHFTLSIDPSHTPELASMKTAPYPLTPATSPSSSHRALPSTSPPSLPSSPPNTGVVLTGIGSVLPISRDWRRFLKKCHRLEQITWGGRGGIGSWTFEKGSTLATTKIEFSPIVGGGTTTSILEGMESPKIVGRSRRASSVSLVGSCLSGLSIGGGGGTEQESPISNYSSRPEFGLGFSTSPSTSFASTSSPSTSPTSTHHHRRKSHPSPTTTPFPPKWSPYFGSAGSSTGTTTSTPPEDKQQEHFPPLSPTLSQSQNAPGMGKRRTSSNTSGESGKAASSSSTPATGGGGARKNSTKGRKGAQ